MTEVQFLAKLKARAPAIGDDCAVLDWPASHHKIVVTTDMLVEDAHFRRGTHTARQVGYKALARGLSDIAAMGADPLWYLVSVAFPPWSDSRWREQFCDGHLALAQRHGVELVGGDTGHAERFACDVVVIGQVPWHEVLLRSTAAPGDWIYVSGELGGSSRGLTLGRGPAWRRHLRPVPRLELGRYLRRRASACMDLSDGLAMDLSRLCMESRVAADLREPVPAFPGATPDEVLYGGEDYELLFTAPPGIRIPDKFGKVYITRIGEICVGPPGTVRVRGVEIPVRGYDHFQ
jgi:thiamine-monophosphate kinase